MCVTTVVLSTCARSAVCRFSVNADCSRIGGAHRLHALVERPTGARLVAGGCEKWRHEWIKDVHLDPAGCEGVPAAFGRRTLLADQSVDHALPINGSTLKPARSNNPLATGAKLVSTATSENCSKTIGVPS